MIDNPFASAPESTNPMDLPLAPNRSPNAGKNSAAEQGLEVPMGWKPTAKEPVPVVRCSSNSTTTGERCKRWSLRGTTVCVFHGGQLPSVRDHAEAVVDAARMRLMGLADAAVDVMEDLIQTSSNEAIRLKAAENVLNRVGIRDSVDVNIEVTHTESAALTIAERLKAIRGRAEPEEIVDAEVLDNEQPQE
mgnify:CR=1 FL=1